MSRIDQLSVAVALACDLADPDIGDMSKYPRFEYSGKAVIKAGQLIAGDLLWTEKAEQKLREAFRIANSWRKSHAYPMRSIRGQVVWYMHDKNIKGTTSATNTKLPSGFLKSLGLKVTAALSP